MKVYQFVVFLGYSHVICTIYKCILWLMNTKFKPSKISISSSSNTKLRVPMKSVMVITLVTFHLVLATSHCPKNLMKLTCLKNLTWINSILPLRMSPSWNKSILLTSVVTSMSRNTCNQKRSLFSYLTVLVNKIRKASFQKQLIIKQTQISSPWVYLHKT